MKREKYIYNPKTLQYEPYHISKSGKARQGFAYFLSISLVSLVLCGLAYTYLPTPKEKTLEKEIRQMEYHYSSLTEDFDVLAKDLERIHQKDAEVHRLIFGMEPIDDQIWSGGIGGTDRSEFFDNYTTSKDFIAATSRQLEKIKFKMELQRESLDTIYTLAVDRAKRLSSIPSIKPVREDQLKRKISHMSGFGFRIHPIHKVKKFHKGIDFTAPSGTPIQATGDGKVVKVTKTRRGYGNHIVIDHGYGYTTMYAHMNEILVKQGEDVIKGQQIGTIGNSGLSTAPHLHYEVRIDDKCVNPIDYCLDGLSLDEYQMLVNRAGVENQSFD